MLLQIARTIFRRRLASAIAWPIFLLLLFSGVSLWQVHNLLSALLWVDHTDRVIAQANYTQALLLDLDTGVRGYLLTGKPEFLQPYQKSSLIIDDAFQRLINLVSDNPKQVQHAKKIYQTYKQWKTLIPSDFQTNPFGEARSLSGLKVRKQKTDLIRNQIAAFIEIEAELRDYRSQVARETTQQAIAVSVFLTLTIGVLLVNFIRRQLLEVSHIYEDALRIAAQQRENAQRAAQRLNHLHEIDKAILSATSNHTIVQDALHSLKQLVQCQQAFLIIFNFETNTAQLITDDFSEDQTLLIDKVVAAELTKHKEMRFIKNITTCNVCSPILTQLKLNTSSSCLIIPLYIQEDLIGQLCLAAKQAETFDHEAQEIAQEVGQQLAIAIHQSQLRQQLQNYTLELEQRVEIRTAQLQEINRELEGFSYSVSHDLRAPLRTIQGFAQALLEDYNQQIDQIGQQYLQYINEGAMEMDTLISELLSYSRLSQAEIQVQPVNLNAIVNEAINQLNNQINEKQATILVNPPLPEVLAHYRTLLQVIINLIGNAIKFSKPHISPVVEIYAEEYNRENTNWVKLWVIDNGIGIAPEHQERIFQIFEKLHGIEVYSGTGIGLAIVRKGLERMNGCCGVESQLGVGSRFWIALPKAFINSASNKLSLEIEDSNT